MGRILIFDRDVQIRELMKLSLVDWGHSPEVVEGAVETVGSRSWDAAVIEVSSSSELDRWRPVLDACQLRIAVTNRDLGCELAGVDIILAKPFRPRVLQGLLERAIPHSRRSGLDEQVTFRSPASPR